MSRKHGNPVFRCELSERRFRSCSFFPEAPDLVGLQYAERGTAQAFTLVSGVLQPSFDSLHDQRPFPLSDSANNLKQHLSVRQ